MNDSRDIPPVAKLTSITGRSAFLGPLEDEAEYLFGNPGTTELAIMAALGEHPDLRYVLGLQEAVVVAMADGYARASNRLAACNVHVAPGLGNAMGSLFNANWYGSPLLITAGQQEQGHGLTEPLLYAPLVPIAQPIVKWAVESRVCRTCRARAPRCEDRDDTAHRSGVHQPPGDILDAQAELDLGKPTRVDAANRPSDES
jgi:benzoylformate decarboxylase